MCILFRLKQNIKMYIQNVYLPQIYRKEISRTRVNPDKIILADMHSDSIPFSMKEIYNSLVSKGKKPTIYCRDTQKMSPFETMKFMKEFMREYAAAGYVYICSYFLPVSSCEKRKETKVIQLWHSGGLLKKMGYDTSDDIPEYYKGNVTANYDLVTVSADICVPVWEQAWKLPKGITKAAGLARTDSYFDNEWNENCINEFYEMYPEAKGKKVALYAPSFSGNASAPYCAGIESGIEKLMDKFKDDWFFLISLHPHLKGKYPDYFRGKYGKLPTERIIPVVSLLITDYSSVLFDYAIYKKPFVLFCPDIEEFQKNRGFYTDIMAFPAPLAKTMDELEDVMMRKLYFEYDEEEYVDFCNKYMGACDGNSADRIIELAEKL